jgi:phage-related minor tail protein
MAGRIKGITIEIDGNTTQLQKSLKDVDKSLRDTQKSLKDVDKLLKLDPSNTELLRQKQDLLAKAIQDTKSRLDKLKEAQKQMDANGVDKNSEQYQALTREIIECEQALQRLQSQQNAFNPSVQAFGVKMGELSEKTKGLSTAALGVGTAMLGMAYKAGTTADDLLTLSRNTGISIEELQKMQYASDLVDVSMDQMTGSLTKMVKQMASGNKAFETLGVSITDADGNMRDATDVWYDSLRALSQVENGTLRDQLAMELFGKSAMELSGIVDDGGQALAEYGQQAEDMGLILSEDGVNAAGQFNDAIDQLKATATQSFFEAGAALSESLLPMLETLVQKVSEILIWFSQLDGNTQMLILTIIGLVAAISPIAGLISGIVTIGGALAAVTAPMAATFMGIAAAVGVVIAIGTVLYQNWDTIKAKGAELMNKISEVWNNIKNTVSNAASGAWQAAVDKFNAIRDGISNAINSAKETVRGAIEAIKGFFNFSWSLPHIALPHFSISGKFSLNPPSIPHIGVEWYAKAMNNGMILDSPTIFGMNNGRLLGAGEAGAEVVVGASSLYGMIQKAMGSRSVTAPVNVTVNVNGNIDDSDRFARQLGDRLANIITRNDEVWK